MTLYNTAPPPLGVQSSSKEGNFSKHLTAPVPYRPAPPPLLLEAIFSSRTTAPAQTDAPVSILVALRLELRSPVSLRRRCRRRRLPRRAVGAGALALALALARPAAPNLIWAVDAQAAQRPRRL